MLDLKSNWGSLIRKNKNQSYGFDLSLGNSYSVGNSHSYGISQSSSSSFSGLSPEGRNLALGVMFSLSPALTSLARSVATGKPNKAVFENLSKLSKLATQDWMDNVRPIYENRLRGAINSLYNRGVLDSSVASHALGSLSSGFLTNYANLLRDVERKRIQTALEYPLMSLRALGSLFSIAGSLARFQQSSSHSEGKQEGLSNKYSTASNLGLSRRQGFGWSYDPSPAIGLLASLMGI